MISESKTSPDPDAATYFHLSAVRAIGDGKFPGWWADLWFRNGIAEGVGADRIWLERLGRRIDDALRDDEAREERLQALAAELSRESDHGPLKAAATYFLVEVVAGLCARAGRERAERAMPYDAVSIADVLTVIHDPAATTLLAELLATAPTRH